MGYLDQESTLNGLERERCDALLAGDIGRLHALLSDELVHIHTNGASEDRESYLKGVAERLEFLTIERSDVQTRLFGATAVMTGELRQTLRVKATGAEVDLHAITTLVWVMTEGRWRLANFQATRLGR